MDTHVASRRLRADDHGFRLHLRSSTFGMVDNIVNNCVNVCIADGSAVGHVQRLREGHGPAGELGAPNRPSASRCGFFSSTPAD